MRIRSTDVLFGLPALELRHFLRRIDSWNGFDLKDARDVRPMSRNAAKQLIAELADAGYLEPAKEYKPGTPRWRLSVKGRALTIASAARPIRRATADRLLAEFLDRVDAVNADTGFLFRVTEAAVFGSYLGNEPTLGDVDVGIRLKSRLPPDADPVEYGAARVDLAMEKGRVFNGWFAALDWPYREVWLKLKSRSRGLSLHDMESDSLFKRADLKLRVIYANGRRV